MKKFALALLLSCSFIFLLQPSSEAEVRFSDLPAHLTELQQAVHTLNDQKIVHGFSDGTFRPNEPITREQFAVILARTLNLNVQHNESPFADVPTDTIYSGSIRKLTDMGIINGFPDGLFYPKEKVTRLQAATMLNRAFQISYMEDSYFFTDVDAHNTHIKALYFNGITNGMSETEFGPSYPITRGQASIFIYRILQMDKRGNVVYYNDTLMPITSTQLVEQSNNAVRLVPSVNGLRIIPVQEGSGQLIVKGILRETTVPIEKYIAYTYDVTVRNGKYYVTAQEVPLADVLMHESHFYLYDTLTLSFVPTAATVVNAFDMVMSPDFYYIGRNEQGLEIALFEPGEYTITFSNGTQSKQLKAKTTIQHFTTKTTLMYGATY